MGKNSVGTAKMAEQPYPPKKRISGNSARMRDVAKRAGVSTMTVSRALNEPSKVSAEMRKRERAYRVFVRPRCQRYDRSNLTGRGGMARQLRIPI